MTNIISLPIHSSAQILVAEGDRIAGATTIARYSQARHTETIHLAKLLNVPNKDVPKYLHKKIGDRIESGDILAKKKGFFSTSAVRSPISGKIAQLDVSDGTMDLLKFSAKNQDDVISPVSGKVISVGKSAVEIETDNPVFKTSKGEGRNICGHLIFIEGEETGILDIHGDAEDSIVMCNSIDEAAQIKLLVLGGKGIILQKVKVGITIPWVQVDETVFKKLAHFSGKGVWLIPENRQIVILD